MRCAIRRGEQSLLLNPDEVKDLESFTKVLENANKWDFAQAVRVMSAERSMTPAVIADLTRILKASFPFDKLFPGGFGGLNFLQLLRLSPLATAAHMGMFVTTLTEALNFNGDKQGFFFEDSGDPPTTSNFDSPLYIQPALSITSENCTQFQNWSTTATRNFVNGSWPLPLSCSLIYRKVVVFQELLYRFVIAFVKACVAADLGWAAGMLTTLETLRDNESVRERPQAILTSLDAFMHGRVGDLYLAFRAQSILASVTKLVTNSN